mmetsp:Transcript_30466/g.46031  ORF Transcript_30466/g.46031 Transcript_30466/m.46031 type:complete len:558 (-) Transcript_30466:219-1892(-)
MTSFLSSFEGLVIIDKIGLTSKCMKIAIQHVFVNSGDTNEGANVLDTHRHIIDQHHLYLQIQHMCTTKSDVLTLTSSVALRRIYACIMVSASVDTNSSCYEDDISGFQVGKIEVEYERMFPLLSSILGGYLMSSSLNNGEEKGDMVEILCGIVDAFIKTDHWGLQKLLCHILESTCSNLDVAIFIARAHASRLDQLCSKLRGLEKISSKHGYEETINPTYLANLFQGNLGSSPSPPSGDCMMIPTIDISKSEVGFDARVRFAMESIREQLDGDVPLSAYTVCEALHFLLEPSALDSMSSINELSLDEDPPMGESRSITTKNILEKDFASGVIQFIESCFRWNKLEIKDFASLGDGRKVMTELIFRPAFDSHFSVDWFAVCIMALCKGDIAKTKMVLDTLLFGKKNCVALLHYRHAGGIDSGCTIIVRMVYEVLECECPEVIVALEEMGFPLSSTLLLWIRQSFVGILSFGDALLLNGILIALGVDYYVYFTVAILRHLQPAIIKQSSLYRGLNGAAKAHFPIRDVRAFRVVDALDYADCLCRRHRGHCLKGIVEKLR